MGISPELSLATAWYLKACGVWANKTDTTVKRTIDKVIFFIRLVFDD